MLSWRASCILACTTMVAASLPATPTFYKDVMPILQAHCVDCHRPGQVAPMSLITYEQARPWAAAIREAVVLRKMPPWPADAPLGHFANDWRLRDSEIERIRQWADGKAPAGDPKDAPPARVFTEGWQLGEPDIVLRLPREQHVPGNGEDLWKFIFFDRVFDRDTRIRALEIKPGNRKVVHHANVHVVTPLGKGPVDWSSVPEDMEAPGNQGGKLTGFREAAIHVGLPGRFSFQTAPGSAVLIPKGSRMRINIHYAPAKTAETDQTEVGLYLAQEPVAKEWRDFHLRLTNMQIPAGDANYQIEGTRKVTAPITVYQVGAHMHIRGKAYRIDAELPDGHRIELLNVGRFSFDWQLMYALAEPVHLPAGTVIRYRATYDNSAANPLVMRYDTPNRLVTHGERTVDEMMGGFVMHTVDSEELTASGAAQ